MAPLEVYVTFYSDEKQKTDRKDRTHMWHELIQIYEKLCFVQSSGSLTFLKCVNLYV